MTGDWIVSPSLALSARALLYSIQCAMGPWLVFLLRRPSCAAIRDIYMSRGGSLVEAKKSPLSALPRSALCLLQ